MAFTGRVLYIFAALMLVCAFVSAATLTADGLSVTIDERGYVTEMAAGGKNLEVTPKPLVSLSEVGKSGFVAPDSVSGDVSTEMRCGFDAGQADVMVKAKAADGALRFDVHVQGDEVPARGLLLRLAFPFDATGWNWHADVQTSEKIAAGKRYENVRALKAYADMPEWEGQPDLKMGYSNRNFCTVVTGPTGLCMAVPIDRPSIFRTAYNGTEKQLEIIYDFCLTPDSAVPCSVDFAFDLYPCDTSWGFRSALARYYRIYPDLFKVYIRDQGQWMAFSRLSQLDNANEFGFGLQEGAPEAAYDDTIDVLSTTYFTHAGQFAKIPGYDPETQPLPAFEEQLKAMNAAFRASTGEDGVYEAVGLHTSEEKLDIRKASVYGHIIAQFNLDPELRYGEWTLERALKQIDDFKTKRNADLDGYYYDGLSSGVNYRKDHFSKHNAPILWDPVAQKPFINNFFSSCEFARGAAELLRPRGKITMMNGALGASFYVAPWLDVMGAETGLRIPREDFNYIRATTYHKPFLTLLKGNFEQQLGHEEIELFHKRCLAYGVFPGFFDWPPSGLGPGGQYWNHPQYMERDRDIFRKYQPLCRELALAGWEPVTFARSSEEHVFVERFGPDANGIIWLTLLNEEASPHQTTLSIDAAGLGIDAKAVNALDVVTGLPVAVSVNGKVLTADISIPSDGVMAIQIATPEKAAAWRAQQAKRTVERGVQMRQVDEGKPALPVHWVSVPASAGAPVVVDGDTKLVYGGTEGKGYTAQQWAMLFQPAAETVTLKVRASGENLEGKAGQIGVSCRLAWVTPSFTYYETRFFDLPTGTFEEQDFEFAINTENALRAIAVLPTLAAGTKGKLTFSQISLSDTNRDEYVVDPGFEQWYEPVPENLSGEIEAGMQAIVTSLDALAANSGNLSSENVRNALAEASGEARAVRGSIEENAAQNGCRRVLRDLDTVEEHLGFVTLNVYDMAMPKLIAPYSVAPGDEVSVSFPVPERAGVVMRTELVSEDVSIPAGVSGCRVRIPDDAKIGSTVSVTGLLHIGSDGKETTLRTTHKMVVKPALELSLMSQGVDTSTGAARLNATVRNNRVRSMTPVLRVDAPEGWRVTVPAIGTIAGGAVKAVEIAMKPVKGTPGGAVDVRVSAEAEGASAMEQTRLLYIPQEANLVRNPGFEDGAQGWGIPNENGGVTDEEARSGKFSAMLVNATPAQNQMSTAVALNQKAPCPVLIRAASKALNVSGGPDHGYALYVDIYYTDGTPSYGNAVAFQTGTTDWQMAELYFEPEKPIRTVNLYLLLRGKCGKVWFDDVAVMEDPRRQGNLARGAEVSVDSSYSGYDASPIVDGKVEVEGLHWTKQAWASADNANDHWVEMAFAEPIDVAKVHIHWALDGGVMQTSREVQVQVPDGDGWKTVATLERNTPESDSMIALDAPVAVERLRLLQPGSKGPESRPGLMWIREVEIF